MDSPEVNTPGTAGDFATSSLEPVGQGHSLERERDLGSPCGGRPLERRFSDGPVWLKASPRTPQPHGRLGLTFCSPSQGGGGRRVQRGRPSLQAWKRLSREGRSCWRLTAACLPIPPGAPHLLSSPDAVRASEGVQSPQ